MTVYALLPAAKIAFHTSAGNLANGYKLFIYNASTAVKATTFTDSTGASSNANPIPMNARGETPYGVYVNSGSYDILYAPSTDTDPPTNVIWSQLAVVGINDVTVTPATEWLPLGITAAYISATSFSVPGNLTSTLSVGRRTQISHSTGTSYSTIVTSTFAAGITTVVVVNDSTALAAGITAVYYGLLSATNPSLPVIFPEGLKNKLLNGDFKVSQRIGSAVQSYGAGAALLYGIDQWYGYCTGASVTSTQVITSLPDKSAYRFTGAASVTGIGFGQRIEKLNSSETSGQTVSLSVVLANSLLTQVSWGVYVANTVNAFGTVAAPTRSLVATGTFTVTSTLTKYAASMAIPAGNYTGLEVVFTVGAQVSGTWTISEAQLELGPTATNFEYRPYSLEELLCQRYYESGFYSFTLPLGNASIVASYLTHLDFKVTKFAIPVIVGTQDQGGTFATSNLAVDSGLFGRSNVIAQRSNSGTYSAEAVIP